MSLSATYQQHAKQYRAVQAETASPTQLVVMLYDGAIRFLSAAKQGMETGDLETQSRNLLKTQKIICELMSTLDRARGGEIAANLHRIYLYMLEQLVEANLYDRTKPLDNVLEMLRDLRASWAEINLQQNRTKAAAETYDK